MARYLITGMAGFIGAAVAERLISDGHTVVGFDNLNDAYDVRLKCWRLERLKQCDRVQFMRLDITDRNSLQRAMDQVGDVDAAINLAARAGVRQSVIDPWVYVNANVNGTLNLLEMCRERQIKKFVQASTSSVYGSRDAVPYRETDLADRPCSPYAATKKAAEALCYSYYHLHRIDVSVLRYFTVYGPAGRPDMSPFRFVQWISEGKPVTIYGDGHQTRDFTYVTDIACGTIRALEDKGWSLYNLGGSQPVPLHRVIETVEDLVGRKAELRYQQPHAADPRRTHADFSLAHEKLGWQPQVSIETGLRHLVEWYRENREWASTIVTN